MLGPIAYLNGEVVPAAEAKLSVTDMGVVQGVAVSEMIRTFRFQPFKLEEHLERFEHSLSVVGIEISESKNRFTELVHQIVDSNRKSVPDHHDLGIVVFATGGANVTYRGKKHGSSQNRPTVCVHTFELPFELWVEKLENGQHLVTPQTHQLPSEFIDPSIKYRSRMHWYLADRQAKSLDPQSVAILTNDQGLLQETATGNFFIVTKDGLKTPPVEKIFPGISRATVFELAESLGIPCMETEIHSVDVLRANDAFVTSTPYCLLPVSHFNEQTISDGRMGPVIQQLFDAWSERVGVDIIEQVKRGAVDRLSEAL